MDPCLPRGQGVANWSLLAARATAVARGGEPPNAPSATGIAAAAAAAESGFELGAADASEPAASVLADVAETLLVPQAELRSALGKIVRVAGTVPALEQLVANLRSVGIDVAGDDVAAAATAMAGLGIGTGVGVRPVGLVRVRPVFNS